MTLLVLLNATLRHHRPDYNAAVGISLEVEPGTTVAQILPSLGVPTKEVSLLMVDGRRRDLDFVLQGDERVALFPPIGGGLSLRLLKATDTNLTNRITSPT